MDHTGHETILAEIEGQLRNTLSGRLMVTMTEFRADGCVTWREL